MQRIGKEKGKQATNECNKRQSPYLRTVVSGCHGGDVRCQVLQGGRKMAGESCCSLLVCVVQYLVLAFRTNQKSTFNQEKKRLRGKIA